MSSAVDFDVWSDSTKSTLTSVEISIYNTTTAEPVTIDTVQFYPDKNASSYTTYSNLSIKAGTTYTLTISGLTYGTAYHSKVVCISTSEGTQMEKGVNCQTDSYGIPLETVYLSSSSAKVKWTPKADSRIVKYRLDVRIDDDYIKQIEITDLSQTSYVVSGLTTSQWYSFQVNVLDSDGWQLEVGSAEICPKKVSAPTINSLTWIGNKITCTWSEVEYAYQYKIVLRIAGYDGPILYTETTSDLSMVHEFANSTPTGSGSAIAFIYSIDYDGVESEDHATGGAGRVKVCTPFVVYRKENGKIHKYKVWTKKTQLWNAKNIYVRLNGVLRKVKNKYLY